MSLKNLEQRFNEKVNQLYAGATSKFNNGKPSNGKTDDPLIVRKPGKGYWTSAEGRMLPLSSTAEDVKRLTLFSLSRGGLLFLAKQQLLQTGNTFEQTRLINPLFAVANAVPFLYVRRNLKPLGGLVAKTDTSYNNVRKLGQLQVSTYNSFTTTSNRFSSFIPASPFNTKKNIGEVETWNTSRPELKDYISTIHNVVSPNNFKFGGKVVVDGMKRQVGNKYGVISNTAEYSVYISNIGKLSEYRLDASKNDRKNQLSVQASVNGLLAITEQKAPLPNESTTLFNQTQRLIEQQKKYFDGVKSTPYIKYFTADVASIKGLPQQNPDGSIQSKKPGSGKISYLKDPLNVTGSARQNVLDGYNTLPAVGSDDAIVVSFAMGKNDPIQFRAFVKDLNQSVTPEYKANQYIGRIEKFISYTGAQREISFKLDVLAFSQTELEAVWKRINYLTGMAYPYGINRGILQPNIIRLTIGNVFENQPGYVTSINTNFNEVSESWDIDDEVPIGATIDMRFVIIEKNVAVANSPFYGINEKQGSGFRNTLTQVSPTTQTT